MSLPRSQSRPTLQYEKDSYEPLHRNWLLFFFMTNRTFAVCYWPFAHCDLSYFFFPFCHSMYLAIYNCILALPIFFYIDLRDAKYARFDYKTVTYLYTYLIVSKM